MMTRSGLWTLLLAFGGLLFWASQGEIEQSTQVVGQVIPSARAQSVQTADGGILGKISVKEGDLVEKGAVLAILDRTRIQAQFQETEARVMQLKAESSRLNAEISGSPLVFDHDVNKFYPKLAQAQRILYLKRTKAVNEEIASLREMLELAEEELNLNLPLLGSGAVSKVEVIKLRRQVADIKNQITTKRNKYLEDAQSELAKAQGDMESLLQTMSQRKDALEHTSVFAPMSGIVNSIKYTTLGSSLKSGDELMQIVPFDDELLIEVKVKPKDIGNLKLGTPATIKIDAYDYTIYGSLRGALIYIGADTVIERQSNKEEPYYVARVKAMGRTLTHVKEGELELQPGMTATVDLITGKNTVLNYLIKPITKTMDNALKER
jgi:adhesin transport system membrane fusion protein